MLRVLTIALCAVAWSAAVAFAQSGPDVQPPSSGFERPVRAVLVSRARAVLSSQLTGRIVRIEKRPGETISKNEVLVTFDCTPFVARVSAVRASLDAAKTRLASSRRLLELNSGGQQDVDLALADVARSEAEIAFLSHDVSNCSIKAPFSGRVVERYVNPFESVRVGDRLIEVVDDQDLEIEMLVPVAKLKDIKVGSSFDVRLPTADNAIPAKVTRLGADVDPASQTVRVFGAFVDIPPGVLSGMGGNVLLSQP